MLVVTDHVLYITREVCFDVGFEFYNLNKVNGMIEIFYVDSENFFVFGLELAFFFYYAVTGDQWVFGEGYCCWHRSTLWCKLGIDMPGLAYGGRHMDFKGFIGCFFGGEVPGYGALRRGETG